jgi:hypothetical protein
LRCTAAATAASASCCAAAGTLRPALLLLLLALLQQLPVAVNQGKEVVKLSIIKGEQSLRQHSRTQHGTYFQFDVAKSERQLSNWGQHI